MMNKKLVSFGLLILSISSANAGTEMTHSQIIISSPDTVASYDCAGRSVNIPAPEPYYSKRQLPDDYGCRSKYNGLCRISQ